MFESGARYNLAIGGPTALDFEIETPKLPSMGRDPNALFAATCLGWSRTRHRLFGPDLPEHKLPRDAWGTRFTGFIRHRTRSGWSAYAGLLLLLVGWLLTAAQPKSMGGPNAPATASLPIAGSIVVGGGSASILAAAVMARRDRIPVSAVVYDGAAPMAPDAATTLAAERSGQGEVWVFSRSGFVPAEVPAGVRRFVPRDGGFAELPAQLGTGTIT